jgi:hypothetical protein
MSGDGFNPTPPAVAWQRWLLTLAGRAVRERSSTPLPRQSPIVTEEVSALGAAAFGAADAIGWQKLWLATQRRPWTSLAVIPVGEGISAPRVARALAHVGSCHLGPIMMVTDATTITLEWLQASTRAWGERRGSIQRVLIALGPVLTSPVSLALAQAVDAAILCLTLGESSISEAAQTIEEVGQERFLGSVILRTDKEKR